MAPGVSHTLTPVTSPSPESQAIVAISASGGSAERRRRSCKPCRIASAHLKNPKNENSPIKTWVLNKGADGFDVEGGSVAPAPKGVHSKTTVVISAPAGTTLYYMCAVHPWMQGKIVVK